MTNSKTTKRALFSSVVALLLCFTMLLGTTFAWFTDTASTAVNTIQAGTLDIVLEYKDANGTWQNAEGTKLAFKDLDSNTYWEPGCTYELPAVRVRNNGNLALKYQIVINGVTGNAKLLEAIEFTANGNAISTFSGHLDTTGAVSEEIVIKGHMKEEAGNEYQGLTLEGIGITVYATQYTYENDSYDNMYDKVGKISNGRIEQLGDGSWIVGADFAATGVKTLAFNVVDTNGDVITTITPETFAIPEDGVIGDPTDGTQYSWSSVCAYVTGSGDEYWDNTAFVPTMDAVPATMELVINGVVVDVCTFASSQTEKWDDAVKAAVSGAIGAGRIEKLGDGSWIVGADFAATGVKTLAFNIVDTNGDVITTITPETFAIPEDGVIGDPTDGTQYSWSSVCAYVTGSGDEYWDNTAFVPTMDAVPATMELVINGVVVATSNVTRGVDLWADAVAAAAAVSGAISNGRIEYTGSRWQISADFAATNVKTLAVEIKDANGNIITTITPETFAIPEDGVIGDPTDGTQYSWSTICAVVTGDSSSWQNTAFVPTVDAVPTTMQLVINGVVVATSNVTDGVNLWNDAVAAYNSANN